MFARYRMNAFSRSAVTSSSFLSFSRWCESVEPAMPVSAWISPTTRPSGMRREQQAHDAQPRLGAERREHVGEAGDVGVGQAMNYISTIVEM